MSKRTTQDALLAECEPYFLDGVRTIAQFAQRTQEIVRDAVERHWEPLVGALHFPEDRITLVDYWQPDKLQKAKSADDGVFIGVKLKVSDVFKAGVYRYWDDDAATGIGVYTWIKGRAKLDQLGKEIDDLPDLPPPPTDSWIFDTWDSGTYYFHRNLAEFGVGELEVRLDELIAYYIGVITRIGGVKRFLSDDASAARIGE